VSVESAAVFSALLSYLRGFDHIPMLVRAYETIRRKRTEFLHQVELTSVSQAMYPPGAERMARDQEMQRNLDAGHVKWDDDAYLGVWGQICEVWAYNAFDAADDWWVQWGILREHSLRLQNSHIETLFHPLEVCVTAHTNLIHDTSCA
jgi:salicylate hydroxylase